MLTEALVQELTAHPNVHYLRDRAAAIAAQTGFPVLFVAGDLVYADYRPPVLELIWRLWDPVSGLEPTELYLARVAVAGGPEFLVLLPADLVRPLLERGRPAADAPATDPTPGSRSVGVCQEREIRGGERHTHDRSRCDANFASFASFASQPCSDAGSRRDANSGLASPEGDLRHHDRAR